MIISSQTATKRQQSQVRLDTAKNIKAIRRVLTIHKGASQMIEIRIIPTKKDLLRLKLDIEECLHYYTGGNQLTYDHLENSIAKVLGQTVPNQELEDF